MTAIADLVSRAERQHLEDRLAELREIDREMRRPGTLAATCEPPPLHDMARTAERTTAW